MKPLHDRVLIEPSSVEEKTASGIIISDTAKEKPQKGKVIAIGLGKYLENSNAFIEMTVAVGDEVLYGKYAGTEIIYEGKDCLIIKESDILAIL